MPQLESIPQNHKSNRNVAARSVFIGSVSAGHCEAIDARLGKQNATWQHSDIDAETYFVTKNEIPFVASEAKLSIVVCGYAVRNDADSTQNIAQFILNFYQSHNKIPTELLDGSFLVAIFDTRDPRQHRIIVHRNFAGTTNLFYRQHQRGIAFATNLSDLIGLPGQSDRLNESMLPTFFLYRCLPGHETLFENCFRVMPGETVEATSTELICNRTSSFSDFRSSTYQEPSSEEVLESIADTLQTVVRNCVDSSDRSGVMLSGGVDSSLLQSFCNRLNGSGGKSYCVTVDHPRTHEEFQYAKSAAHQLNIGLQGVSADRPYLEYLESAISETAEPPNHVQAAYFPELAQAMVGDGVTTGISGEAGDGVFGVGTVYDLQLAMRLRKRLRSPRLCRLLSRACVGQRYARLKQHLQTAAIVDDKTSCNHPINRQASYTHLASVVHCFGAQEVDQAMTGRRSLIAQNGMSGSLVEELHAANMLTSSINSASYWNTLFEIRGGQVLNPFLDSRVLRLAANLSEPMRFPVNNPKRLLKQCLARQGFRELATRRKLGFGQPIFQWLGQDGQLRDRVESIQPMSFVDANSLKQAKQDPNWFLYSLLCLDVLRKRFNV